MTITKSPGLAVGLSAVLPGAGQFYNESYWKVPVVMGLGGYFVYEWFQNDNLAQDYREQYEASKTPEDPDGDTRLLSVRDFYKDQRDEFALYFFILYVANLLDAYVDANLYDFNVGDELTLRVLPGAQQWSAIVPGVSVRLSF
jgi:TM2 domain-containing membrane protein YozV